MKAASVNHDIRFSRANSDTTNQSLKSVMDAVARPIIALTQKFYAGPASNLNLKQVALQRLQLQPIEGDYGACKPKRHCIVAFERERNARQKGHGGKGRSARSTLKSMQGPHTQ